ncbi:MAG: lysophospholipid acyltransferase family protein [Clostridia bacterium]
MKKEKKSLVYRFASGVMPAIYRFIFSCKCIGEKNIPMEGPLIIASNHVTAIDPIILGDLSGKRKVRFMAKDSLFKKKLIGKLLRSLGAFPVIRGTGGEDALAEARKILNDGGVLCVFIEGTRSKDGQLLKPKTGVPLLAFETNATIVPVNIVSEGGQRPKLGRKTMMRVGEPISIEETGMTEASSMHYRRGAKYIMAKITELREKSLEELDIKK